MANFNDIDGYLNEESYAQNIAHIINNINEHAKNENLMDYIKRLDEINLKPDAIPDTYEEGEKFVIKHCAYTFTKIFTALTVGGDRTYTDEHDDITITTERWFPLLMAYLMNFTEIMRLYTQMYWTLHEYNGDDDEPINAFREMFLDMFGFLENAHPRLKPLFNTVRDASVENTKKQGMKIEQIFTEPAIYDLELYRQQLNEQINKLNEFLNDFASKSMAIYKEHYGEPMPEFGMHMGSQFTDKTYLAKIDVLNKDYATKMTEIYKGFNKFSLDYHIFKCDPHEGEWTAAESAHELAEVKKTMGLIDTLLFWGNSVVSDSIKLHANQAYYNMLTIAETQLYPFKDGSNPEAAKQLAQTYKELAEHVSEKTKGVVLTGRL